MVISAVAILATGSIIASALAETSPEPASPQTQIIQLGTVTAPADGASAQRNTLRVRRTHTRPFSAYGVTWAYGSGAVKVTGRVYQDGRWTPWQDLDVDEPARGGTRAGAGLVWAGPSTGIEVTVTSISGARPRQVRVDLINPGKAPGDAEAATVTTAGTPTTAQATMPTIYRRADWGADETKMTWQPEYADKVIAIVLHHTATSNDYQPADVPGIIRSIYQYQAVTLGWGDIGYNVLVDRFGRLWEGRTGGLDKPVIGAHAGGFNTGTAGIAMIGHHSQTAVPAAVIDSAARYAAWRLSPYRADPRGTTTITGGPSSRYSTRVTITVPRIFPHRTTSNTECPGDRGMEALQPIRDKAYWYWRPTYPRRTPWPTMSPAQTTRP